MLLLWCALTWFAVISANNRMQRRVLITGASGLLGSNLLLLRPDHWDCIALAHRHPIKNPPPGIITTNADLLSHAIDEVIDQYLPLDSIIHTAALTNVDQCEREPRFASAFNTDLAKRIARYAHAHDIHLTHLSTDHIFDGKKGDYKEEDAPNPINHYAATKRAAEEAVLRVHAKKSAIIRTNFFGYNMQEKQDLAGWMRTKLAAEEPIRLFRDVYFSPLLVNHLVSAIVEIVENAYAGILHVASPDHCSKYDFGMMLVHTFNFDTKLIMPISVDESGLSVPRPKNMTLNTAAARIRLSTPLPTIAQSIAEYKTLAQQGYEEKLKQMMQQI